MPAGLLTAIRDASWYMISRLIDRNRGLIHITRHGRLQDANQETADGGLMYGGYYNLRIFAPSAGNALSL